MLCHRLRPSQPLRRQLRYSTSIPTVTGVESGRRSTGSGVERTEEVSERGYGFEDSASSKVEEEDAEEEEADNTDDGALYTCYKLNIMKKQNK